MRIERGLGAPGATSLSRPHHPPTLRFGRQLGRADDIHVSCASLVRSPPHILIACMPKSGSTFLSNVIAELPGFRRADLVPDFDRREQELDEFCLRGADPFAYVAQHHVRYSQWTHDLCRDYGLTPIVLVRDLLDVVVSLRDHLRRESAAQPQFFAEAHHAAMDDARLEAMIVRLALPWYLNFYMSWRRAPGALVVRYEDLTADPTQTVREVLRFADVHASRRDIDGAIQRALGGGRSRLNVGASGRGAALSPDLAREVQGLLDFYPEASNDPYVRSLRAKAETAPSGAPLPSPPVVRAIAAPAARKTSALGRWWKRHQTRVFMRVLTPVTLCALAFAYWAWPNDLIPDSSPWGRLDDLTCLTVACLMAGRLTKYRPRPDYLRRRGS
jgi:uncharacterized membrane protein YkvA (DUF1232 family)